MNSEFFDQDRELEHLEEEMKAFFQDLESPPLREGFKNELRRRLTEQAAIVSPSPGKDGANPDRNLLKKISAGIKAAGLKAVQPGRFFRAANEGNGHNSGESGGRRGRLFKSGGLKLVASFVIVILLFTGLFMGLSQLGPFVQPVQAGELTITAIKQDRMGIDPETSFLLSSQNPLDEKTVRETLQVSPAFAYDLEKEKGGREYRIIPTQKLAGDTVYRLSFDPSGREKEALSWAFQTKGSFRVLRTLPGDTTTNVPVNTGIELVFSHENYDPEQVKNYFSISPQVEGRFEKHKRTLVFVPKEMQPGTVYSVTLRKGLPLLESSEVLAGDYSFSFETAVPSQEKVGFTFDIDGSLKEFSTTDAPAYPVYFYKQQDLPPFTVTVYRYGGHTAFIESLAKRAQLPRWSYVARNIYHEDLSGLNRVAEYQVEPLSIDRYSHYLLFPETLEAGYYAAEIKGEDTVRQVWFQITDLATYLAMSEEQSLVWVNDLQTKKPVPGAQVVIESENATYQGDESGVVYIKEGADQETTFALVKGGGKETVVPMSLWRGENSSSGPDPRDYWKYLYLERELFKPGDPLNFWGVLTPRDNGAPMIGEVTVELQGTDGPYYEGREAAPILTEKIPVRGKTFTGQIQLPVLKPGYYYLSIKSGDKTLTSRGFSVELYEKPAYSLEVTPEKRALFAGEGMNYEVKASFFEGTPVPGLSLSYYINGESGTVQTGDAGKARIPYLAKWQDSPYSSYMYSGLYVNATAPEAGEIAAGSGVYVFRSKVGITGKAERKDDGFSLQVKLSNVDLSKINDEGYLSEESYLSAPVGNALLKGKVIQNVWTKVENGEYYDFINKEVRKNYYYRHSTLTAAEFSLITDSAGEATYSGKLEEGKSYYLEVTAEDSEGRETVRRIPIIGVANEQSGGYNYYHLQGVSEDQEYRPGEQVKLAFRENEKDLEPREKGFLYFYGQKGFETYEVRDDASYSFTFSEHNIPNVNVYGAYFDGRSYQESPVFLAVYARETKALKVNVETDRPEYRPGEKVNLKIQVSDQKGRPVKAQVNINLVDEALYSLQEQYVDLLASLYRDYVYSSFSSRKSHYYPDNRFGAEQGGEGGAERRDFRDTVIFKTLETDREGRAETEFTLPDNLTSWRVTYHALTDELQAASGTRQVPVRLPFFVDMALNEVFLAGDSPVVTLRSYGEKLDFQQGVSYTMKLAGPSGEEKQETAQGSAFTPVDWQLPALAPGHYAVTVEGKSGEYRDILTKEFAVVDSLMEQNISDQQLLTENMQIPGSAEEPTTLVFSDYERSQYLAGLYRLCWEGGSRLEQRLARLEARMLLKQYFPEESAFLTGEDSDLQKYQQPDGGLSILPYSESEPALTALGASLGSYYFDRNALAAYFYRLLEQGDENAENDQSLALWGLAALKEPVLHLISDRLAAKDLGPEEKIHLALASLDIGNGAYARQVFGELIKQYGEDLGATIRINAGRDQDEIIMATTQMALLAARLDQPEKNKLYQYLLENSGQDVLNVVEQAEILKYGLRYLDTRPVSFTYELKGEKTSKTLKDRETFQLTLLPEDLSKIKFSQIEGKVGVMTTYTAPYGTAGQTAAEDLSIDRRYLVNSAKTTALGRSDLVQVVLTYEVKDKAPGGIYEIVDVLPAGLRHVSRPYLRQEKANWDWSWPTEVKGQKLTFAVGKGKGKITYYARVVAPGTYRAEPSLFCHTQSRQFSVLGTEDKVMIK